MATGCRTPEVAPDSGGPAEFLSERIVRDGRTVVRNLAGSKWGGSATLREELSIGILEGAEEYMLAQPIAVWATDAAIFVLDSQDHQVRVFDREGVYLRAFGNEGGGPGELQFPRTLAITKDGTVMIASGMQVPRISFFTTEGEWIEDWRFSTARVQAFVTTPAGVLGTILQMPDTPQERVRIGYQLIEESGVVGEPFMLPELGHEPSFLEVNFGDGNIGRMPIPGTVSGLVSVATPSGHIAYGDPSEYRFTIRSPEGDEIDVELVSAPVPVSAEERAYIHDRFVDSMRRNSPDFSWDGAGIPEFKQRYNVMLADEAGRIWISRDGPSIRTDPCTRPRDADPGVTFIPCWETTRILEAFNIDGEYLGRLERPAGISFFGPYFTEDRMFAAIQHPDGIPMVKAFRIVFPTDKPTG